MHACMHAYIHTCICMFMLIWYTYVHTCVYIVPRPQQTSHGSNDVPWWGQGRAYDISLNSMVAPGASYSLCWCNGTESSCSAEGDFRTRLGALHVAPGLVGMQMADLGWPGDNSQNLGIQRGNKRRNETNDLYPGFEVQHGSSYIRQLILFYYKWWSILTRYKRCFFFFLWQDI